MKNIVQVLFRRVQSCISSVGWFLLPAVILAVAYWVVDIAGWRQDTTFLSGTSLGGEPSESPLYGVIYIGLYFGWTLLCPILVLAAGMYLLLHRILLARSR